MKFDLNRFFDAGTIARGQSYFRSGRVSGIVLRPEEGDLIGTVKGSEPQPYTQRIALSFDRNGTLADLTSSCSCPLHSDCKHVVAVLLAFQAKSGAASPPVKASAGRGGDAPAPSRLSPELAEWLALLHKADSEPEAGTEPEGFAATVRDRLLYVLEPGTPLPGITVMKATLLKDGSFSRTMRSYDVDRLKGSEAPKFVTRTDLALLRDLERARVPVNSGLRMGWGTPPQYLPDEPPDLLPLLRRIAATGRARWGEADGPTLTEAAPRRGVFQWQTHADGSQDLVLRDADGNIPLRLLPLAVPVWVDPASGAFGALETGLTHRQIAVLAKAPKLPPDAAAEVGATLAGLARTPLPPPQSLRMETRQGKAPTPRLRLFTLPAKRQVVDGWRVSYATGTLPALRLAFDYDGHIAPMHPPDPLRLRDGDRIVTLKRARKQEDAAWSQLRAAAALPVEKLEHLRIGSAAQPRDLVFADDEWDDVIGRVSDEPLSALTFMARTLPTLRAAGWQIEVDPSWPYPLREEPAQIVARVGSGAGPGGLFDVGMRLTIGDQSIDLAGALAELLAGLPQHLPPGFMEPPLLENMFAEQPCFIPLGDGSHVEIDPAQLAPLMRVFLTTFHMLGQRHPGEAGALADMAEALAGCGIPFEGGAALLELGRRLNALKSPQDLTPPESLRAELRPYQRTGYGWLSALSDTGFGGLLADDMGLGKTVQTLAFLAERHIGQGCATPSLLIVPTSLARAWARQAAQFVPGLKVLVLHGSERKAKFGEIGAHHLVITTYPLLHRDHDMLLTRDWDMAILDEAQAVKNPASSAAKRIRDIRARMRLALTGTPMENTLTDLWALFDWLVPGLLGDRKSFRSQVMLPIERDGDAAVQARLNARIRPFLLRRTKAEVALDLPEKTEITELVPLGPQQQALYETVRVAMDSRVQEAIRARGLAGAHITILDALLKMRQTCCDPRLLKDPGAAKINESAKLDRLMDMLDSLVSEGRRVLVFSQFVEMLRLIETEVRARGWAHEWLSGETTDRDAVITRFQEGGAPVFLISLKAGGVGLTLTAADTVILYDPWWNPAVERQAMDRAHRIGQNRAVFVYRLVAEGTVEEAISAMQARKQALADALFEGGEAAGAVLDEASLAELFRPLGSSADVTAGAD